MAASTKVVKAKTASPKKSVQPAARFARVPQFIEPMLLLKTSKLPEGPDWLYEIKLDGFHALAIKSGGEVSFRSRNDKDLGEKFRSIVDALQKMPDETVIDGELVALDEEGKPSFNLLQNYRSSKAPIVYYAFDLLMLGGANLMRESLTKRRQALEQKVLSKTGEPIRLSPILDAKLADLIDSVKDQGLGARCKAP